MVRARRRPTGDETPLELYYQGVDAVDEVLRRVDWRGVGVDGCASVRCEC